MRCRGGMDGLRAKSPAQFQFLLDDVHEKDPFEAEIPQYDNQRQADRTGPDNCKDCALRRIHQVNCVNSDGERFSKETDRRIYSGIEPESLSLVTGKKLCHRAPATRVDSENSLVGTDMLHSGQAMAANSASQGGINSDTISGTKRHNVGARFYHGAGSLVPHNHARLPSTAFARKTMHIAAADSNRVRANEYLFGTQRRRRGLLN